MTQEYNMDTGETRWRPSVEGDSVYAETDTKIGDTYIDPSEFHCE